MGRRGENIYKRKDKRWEGRYISSYGADGKAVYKSVYGKSYSEVREKMKNRSGQSKPKNADITLAAWMEDYLNSQRSKIKVSTAKVYERYLSNFIKPFFGKTALRQINTEILQSFVNSLSRLSSSTVRGVFSFVREALKTASRAGRAAPVWLNIELPRAEKGSVSVFTREQQCSIEKALDIEERPNDIGILLCLYTGLRIGEVCGLKWEDVDFNACSIFVRRTIQRITVDGKSVLLELPPKSAASRRKIPIPSCIADSLSCARERSLSEYVLSTDFHIMDPRMFQYHYKRTLERAGVRYANAHTMRHTFSVRALELGFDVKTLSEILGHADVMTTLKTYAHSLDEHKRKSMEKFVRFKS